MTHNRLGTLSAALFGGGWLIAVAINIFFWLPQSWGIDPAFYEDSQRYLQFVYDNAITWRVFHIGATTGLVGLILLIPALGALRRDDVRQPLFTAAGVVGAAAGLLASLIDHLGTPVLARYSAGGSQTARIVWEFMEPWRDGGLKTVSFWLLGAWALWMAGLWLGANRRLGRFSQIMGAALLLLALLETLLPLPWRNTWGETGLAGLSLLLLPVWGLWVARWFWQRELAT
ncbi:MAG: hypothetical protein KC418_13595 [Anaerolineales bacterium]|nr:hypothetical protein [Anaerolineales bacterium]MCB8950947.1 hypothetical protein [Ardenticatenales bacterium]